MSTSIARSYLYVPGNKLNLFAKAAACGADAVILDLEDAVPVSAKADTRAAVADLIAGLTPGAPGQPAIWVRVNVGAEGPADARAVAGPALTGIVTAKTDDVADVERVAAALAEREAEQNQPVGSIAISPLLESAVGILQMTAIAGHPRVRRLQLGEADLAADLGVEPDASGAQLLYVRSQLIVTSAAMGLERPIAPVSTEFRDLDAFAESTRALKRMGFVGRACIHPAQVAVVNEVFTPTAEEVAAARALVAQFAAADADGTGAFVGPDGRMIDRAVVRSAERVLQLAAGRTEEAST